MVDAKRIKMWDDDLTGASVDFWVHATYLYEVNGKTYRYKYYGDDNRFSNFCNNTGLAVVWI